MSHTNKIKDCDAFFEVDPITRQIRNMTPAKIVLMQGDHNSEKFTFTLPRYIEGHDMAESAKAYLHYVNPTKPDTGDSHEMKDLRIDPDDAEKVICSWLISANATKEPGALSFLIEFECYDGDVLVYSWHTLPHTGISIGATFNFKEEIATKYADVLEQWEQRLFGDLEKVKDDIRELDKAVAELIEGGGGTGENGGNSISVVQTPGESETAVMSQKAVTEELDSIAKKSQLGNINNATIEAGGWNGAVVGNAPTKFNHANITRCVAPIPVVSGETIYAIFEGITTKNMSLWALDADSKIIEYLSVLYAKNMTSSTTLQTLYTIPEGCTSILFHINTSGSLDYKVGIYYDFYDATTVEEYVPYTRYVDGTRIVIDGKVAKFANSDELNETTDRIGYDNIVDDALPNIDEPDVEYNKHIMKSVRGEIANMWKYLGTKHAVTVLDSGVCGEHLTWALYSDGLLKISGSGRAYDYCKGLFGDDVTREEIEAYQAQYEGLTDADSIAKYERGFQEGKIYDDEHGQYIAPWYKYRPEVDFITTDNPNGYMSKADYDKDNPNGWTYNRIEIDEGITYLGNWMMYRICGATELVIPSTVKGIGQWCIRYSPSLKCVYLPDGITTIEKRGCSRLEVAEAIRLGEGFTTIGDYAFAQNPMVKSLHIKGNVSSVGENPFYGDTALETITLDGVTVIDGVWFIDCNNMTRVQLAEGLTSIIANGFVNKANLTTVNIPSSVATIGASAFYGCTNLKYLYIDSPTVAQGLVNVAATANFGHVNYYAKYIYIKNTIENVGAWFENYCTKYSDIDGYTLYVRNE